MCLQLAYVDDVQYKPGRAELGYESMLDVRETPDVTPAQAGCSGARSLAGWIAPGVFRSHFF